MNMPADNIKRTIDKATGGGDAEQFEEIVYEGYGPGGIAILVEAQTDNRNRTAAEVRSIFTKAGGQLAGSGAVAWQFEPRGLIEVPRAGIDVDEVTLAAIDAGAEDVDTRRRRDDRHLHRAGRARGGPPKRSRRPASRWSRPNRRWSPSRPSSSTRRRHARRSAWSSCSRISTTCRG